MSASFVAAAEGTGFYRVSASMAVGNEVAQIVCGLFGSHFKPKKFHRLPDDIITVVQRAEAHQHLPERGRRTITRHGSFLFFDFKDFHCSDNGWYLCKAFNTTDGAMIAEETVKVHVPKKCGNAAAASVTNGEHAGN